MLNALLWNIKTYFHSLVVYVILFCGLFNNSVNSSDYTVSNDRMVNYCCIGKDMEEDFRSLIYGAIRAVVWKHEKNHEKPHSG
jgi:hypothetical protein